MHSYCSKFIPNSAVPEVSLSLALFDVLQWTWEAADSFVFSKLSGQTRQDDLTGLDLLLRLWMRRVDAWVFFFLLQYHVGSSDLLHVFHQLWILLQWVFLAASVRLQQQKSLCVPHVLL